MLNYTLITLHRVAIALIAWQVHAAKCSGVVGRKEGDCGAEP
jgi:hypothetical protein